MKKRCNIQYYSKSISNVLLFDFQTNTQSQCKTYTICITSQAIHQHGMIFVFWIKSYILSQVEINELTVRIWVTNTHIQHCTHIQMLEVQ